MRYPLLTTLLSSFASIALADVEFTKPAAGATLAGGTTLSIAWKESGTAPAITLLSSYQLFLMAGGNTAADSIQLDALVTAGTFATDTASATISTGLGAATKNAYFLKMISVYSEGGTIINYSDRFTLTGMDGTFPATVIAGIATIDGTAGPATEDDETSTDTTAAAGDSEYTVPYQSQTGLTKYAPMQPVPPTKITAKTYTPLHPTSAFTIATTAMPIPTIVTTITEAQTYSVSSMENTIAAAAAPTEAMAKFLNRWKD